MTTLPTDLDLLKIKSSFNSMNISHLSPQKAKNVQFFFFFFLQQVEVFESAFLYGKIRHCYKPYLAS
jgi:hypothetical protein